MPRYTVVAFYKFISLSNLTSLQLEIDSFASSLNILGTIILSEEGINGTLSGSKDSIHTLMEFLKSKPAFQDLDCKYSSSDVLPFHKLKILIKKEIVTFVQNQNNPSTLTGKHVSPAQWNDLISDPDVIVVDTRNTYEINHGSFKGALNPNTEKFTDFPNFVKTELQNHKDKKIAIFCTGGIRCEKASTYLLENGFEEVYQLEGGILKYLETIPTEQSLWQGKCFIFDDRTIIEKNDLDPKIDS